ncbi:nucleotidyltransferase family protein [Paenibacillus sp. CAU 1782]
MGSGIAGLYLAAGSASRMGRSKLDIEWPCAGGETLGGMGLAAALDSRLDSVYVVIRKGSDRSWLKPYSRGPDSIGKPCVILEAEGAELGMSHSIRSGLETIRLSGELPRGLVILLGDQPLVTGDMINHLICRFLGQKGLDYVASSDGVTRQPPILLASSMYGELLKLNGDAGARKLLADNQWRGDEVLVPDFGRLLDVDTEEDLQELNRYYIALKGQRKEEGER